MGGKATKSGEQVVIFNVYKYFKVHNPSESQNFLFKCTSEALSISTVRRIVKVMGLKRQVKKKIEKKTSVMYQSISSLTIPTPGKSLGNFLMREFPTLGQKESSKPQPPGPIKTS